MKVGLLVLMAGREAGGPETYEVQLIRALLRADQRTEFTVYCTTPTASGAIGVEAPNLRYHLLPGNRVVSMIARLPWQVARDRIDVLHSTYVPPPWVPVRQVMTFHCLSSFERPDFYTRAVALRLNVLLSLGTRAASHLLCISETIRRGVHARFGVPFDRMSVSYPAVDSSFHAQRPDEARRRVEETIGIREPYLLYLGKLEPRKNVERLISAFARYRELGGTATLVMAGHRTTTTPAIDTLIDSLGVRDAIVCPGYLPQALLPALYSGARMFLFPSLWEGFGIPLIEAMACGCPVLTSNVTCLPEVAGQAAVYVDPTSVEDIVSGIMRLECSGDLRAELTARGLDRAAQFSWDLTASQTLAAYRRAVA
jgi:glycosyltransferase involved in cell wall biosynthesis